MFTFFLAQNANQALLNLQNSNGRASSGSGESVKLVL
jgi:hypothetical protein